MSFADIFDETDEAAIMDILGDVCTYNGATIMAIVDHNLQEISMADAYTTTSTISVRVLKSDVPKIKRGSKLIHANRTIIVDAIVNDINTHLTLACRYT